MSRQAASLRVHLHAPETVEADDAAWSSGAKDERKDDKFDHLVHILIVQLGAFTRTELIAVQPMLSRRGCVT